MRHLLIILALFLVACNEDSLAGTDEGLYDPVAPKGSAFVRFINKTDTTVEAKAAGKSFGDVAQNSASAYYVVKQGEQSFSLGDSKTSAPLTEGAFYSIIESKVITDTPNEDRAKATVAFYNLSAKKPMSLKAKAGSVDVVKDLPSMAMGTRDINPLEIDLSIAGEGVKAITIEPIILERGNHYSIIYDGDKPFVVKAETDTRK